MKFYFFCGILGLIKGELMGSKREYKELLNKEKVYKAVASNPGDLVTVQERLLKHRVVESRLKIRNAINSLVEEGRLVIKDKKIYPNPSEIKQGKFIRSGNSGYVVFSGDSHEYYVDRSDMADARNNSLVNVSFYTKVTRQGEQKAIFVVGQAKQEESTAMKDAGDVIYGRVMKIGHDDLVFIANDRRRARKPILIINDKKTLAKYENKICTMRLLSPEDGNTSASGVLLEIKGEAGNPISEYDAIAESHGAIMNYDYPKMQEEIAKIPNEVDLSKYSLCSEQDLGKTDFEKEPLVDLRDLAFTTTDPATCKDMDDAIYSTFDKDGNIVVYTAVANVSKYVDLNSEIGRRYLQSSFTIYAPNKAYNILPPELSTNICSLNPNVDRLAFVVKTIIDPKSGSPVSSTIMDAVIRSKEKYSYEKAQEIVDENKEITKTYLLKKITSGEQLTREEQVVMNKVASDFLWKGFKRRNMIEFDSDNEYDIKLSDDLSDIVDITKENHCPYHKVIEAFMLTANEATAEFTLKNNLPSIYRVHDLPNEDKVERAYEFFGYLNVPFDGDLSPMGIKNIIEMVKGTSKEKIVNNFLVRMQSKAKYCPTVNPADVRMVGKPSRSRRGKTGANQVAGITFAHEDTQSLEGQNSAIISHFGLQSLHYSHTTSPIRRSPDWFVHRVIRAYLKGEKLPDEGLIKEAVLMANQMQDEVDCAEHEIDDLNSAIYCSHMIGQKMKGQICSFRKLVDKGTISPDEVVVVVENEDKGIKVDLPLSEVLAYKGCSSKNIAISPSGSAIVNRQSGAPILILCQELTFKITNSNRITRQVSGSMDLTSENVVDEITELQRHEMSHISNGTPVGQKSRKVVRMHQNREYNKQVGDKQAEFKERKATYGLKFINQIDYSGLTDDMKPEEAYDANKNSSKRYKRKKKEQETKAQLDEYRAEVYEDEKSDN